MVPNAKVRSILRLLQPNRRAVSIRLDTPKDDGSDGTGRRPKAVWLVALARFHSASQPPKVIVRDLGHALGPDTKVASETRPAADRGDPNARQHTGDPRPVHRDHFGPAKRLACDRLKSAAGAGCCSSKLRLPFARQRPGPGTASRLGTASTAGGF